MLNVKKAGIAVAIATFAYIAPATATNEVPNEFAFKVKAKGVPGGLHQVRYREQDGETFVDISAKLKFKVAFITVMKLDHEAHEIWRDGRLVSLQSRTKRNGDEIFVNAAAEDTHLAVQTHGGDMQMPLDSIPTSFTKDDIWIDEGTRQITLLDTLNGRERPSTLQFKEHQRIKVKGAAVDVRYYSIVNNETGELSHEFWIDEVGMAMRIHLHTESGTLVKYLYHG